jgi:hypothetical protein
MPANPSTDKRFISTPLSSEMPTIEDFLRPPLEPDPKLCLEAMLTSITRNLAVVGQAEAGSGR